MFFFVYSAFVTVMQVIFCILCPTQWSSEYTCGVKLLGLMRVLPASFSTAACLASCFIVRVLSASLSTAVCLVGDQLIVKPRYEPRLLILNTFVFFVTRIALSSPTRPPSPSVLFILASVFLLHTCELSFVDLPSASGALRPFEVFTFRN